MFIGGYPLGNGDEEGVLINWSENFKSTSSVSILQLNSAKWIKYLRACNNVSICSLHPDDNNFLTVFVLMYYEKEGDSDHKLVLIIAFEPERTIQVHCEHIVSRRTRWFSWEKVASFPFVFFFH